jgi:hypothetical protein
LASLSVTARAAEISIVRAAIPSPKPVSAGSNVNAPSIAIGQPWRNASIARATRRDALEGAALKYRTR